MIGFTEMVCRCQHTKHNVPVIGLDDLHTGIVGHDGKDDVNEPADNDVSWVRHAREAESMAGLGTKSWVALQFPILDSGACQTGYPTPGEQRILIGNRRLLSEEGITISR